MKKITLLLTMVLLLGTQVNAQDYAYQYPAKIRATYYTAKEGSVTKSGEHVRKGILAGKDEWLGKAAILYDMELNIIGYYEFKDTGSHKGIKDGTRIDVFMESEAEAQEWLRQYGDYVVMQIVEAEG